MKSSPFLYGVSVRGDSFTNREEEVKQLKNNFIAGINTIIISPRRWGKTSLVNKVMEELRGRRNFRMVRIDLFAVDSEKSFFENYAREVIKASSGKWEEWLQSSRNFFKAIVPKVSFSIDPQNDFSIGFEWEEVKKYKDEILDLPEKIAKEKGIRFTICIDEFQRIADFKEFENFERLLRSVWQKHSHVSYCLFGSKRHMMSNIFTTSSKPFYRFGEVIMLKKIKREKWIDFIKWGFRLGGKSIDDKGAGNIAGLMQDHPWYVQQLCHLTFSMTEKKAGNEQIEMAIQRMLQSNSLFYEREVEILSSTQLNLLKAVICGETKLTSKAVMDKFALGSPNNVRKNKIILTENDMLELVDNHFEFLDPAFEMWFRRQFFS